MTSSAVILNPMEPSDAQARLDALIGSTDNFFESMTWLFKDQNSRLVTVDFNYFASIADRYPYWSLAHSIDLVLLTKWMFLSYGLTMKINTFGAYVNGLKLFWTVMAKHDLSQLTRDNCTEVLTFLLMHGLSDGNVIKGLVIKSYGNFSQQINFKHFKEIFHYHNLDLISRNVTGSFITSELKTLVPKLTDTELTYRDWLEGGSYNTLTLDHGCYYVEHCLSFFEKNYPLAIALVLTHKATPAIAISSGYSKNTVGPVLSLILQGESVEDIQPRWPTLLTTTLQKIYDSASSYFESAYRQARLEAALLQSKTLENFVIACGLESSSENIDRMRIVLWDWVRHKNKTETQSLLNQYQNISWAVFENQLNELEKYYDDQLFPIPSRDEYQVIGLIKGDVRDAMSSYSLQLRYFVEKAGLTAMAALTGWRRSELGFPLLAIKRTRNNDKLDQYAFPWRYQVDWYVYKTSGKVRQLREISFNTFLIAERMQSLVNGTDEEPCLYAVTRKNINPYDPGTSFDKGVRRLWGHFVNHYEGFKKMDDWSAWQALQEARRTGESLTQVDQQELDRLLTQRSAEQWTQLSIDTNLKEAWRRAREEWPRIEMFLMGSNTIDKKNWLACYRNGTLRSDWHALLDTYLLSNTKNWINSLSQDELKSGYATKGVMNQLIEGTLRPSPHAFRHMWAEAVYRRFDGDAGWMIRSQFKHISQTMWLAYIRDKDNRVVHEKAKTAVISSLVRNYLKNKGKGYAGQMHIWLRRLFNKTSVVMPEEQERLAKHIATIEIENIKASPWGYCLLKRRTKSHAKCAEMGEPMPHNASPDLCLGCIHSLMQTENVEWTLFHVASHVGVLKNPIVPAGLKVASYKLVKNVARQVSAFNPQHEALTELQEVLGEYEASRIL